jgi:competence protein ComEC
LFGLIPFVAGAVGAALTPTPDLLVTGDGMHLAVVSGGRPVILRDRTGDFVQQLLAESAAYDGDPAFLSDAPFADCSNDSCIAEVRRGRQSWRVFATRSSYRLAWQDVVNACEQSDLAVSDRRLPAGCDPKWLKLDAPALRRTGGVAVYLGADPHIVTVAQQLGQHPWAVAPASVMPAPRCGGDRPCPNS